MLSLARSSGRLPLRGFALALGISVFFGSSVMADGGGHADFAEGRFKQRYLGEGTLGWAEYGLYPGLYGFSLRWHPGYGYGRYASALAPTADIRSTAALAIPTRGRNSGDLGPRPLLPITAAPTILATAVLTTTRALAV